MGDMTFDHGRRQRGGAMRFEMDKLVVVLCHSDESPVGE
jgi:hypothetical protein